MGYDTAHNTVAAALLSNSVAGDAVSAVAAEAVVASVADGLHLYFGSGGPGIEAGLDSVGFLLVGSE